MAQRTIVFLSYYRHHDRLFRLMSDTLPEDITARHLNIYRLTPASYCTRAALGTAVTEEIAADITRFYRLKKTARHPQRDTTRWRQRLHRRAAQWYQLFRKKLADADMLVVWSGFAIPLQAAVAAARSLGIPIAFCENGVLPGTMAIDAAGINFANSLTGGSAEFYRAISTDEQRVDALLSQPLQQRPLRKVDRNVNADCDDDKPLPARYVLFAMQVHDDSQVLLFSPRFRSMEEAIPYVWEQLQAYNANTGDNLVLLVKEHPSDYGRIDYQTLRASIPGARFLRTTPISAIIGNAQAVITINSSVGVEGLLSLRPVITLGDAFYNVPGVVRHLEAGEELAAVLPTIIDQPVDQDLITRFLYYLRYDYLISTTLRGATRETIMPATQRVLAILEHRQAVAAR